MTATPIAVAPTAPAHVVDAIRAAGGEPTALDATSRALIWVGNMHAPAGDAGGLADALRSAPALEWVQLPSAGVDELWRQDVAFDSVTWTSAKGAFSKPVAEHALTLALAGLRMLPTRITARSWGASGGTSLYDADVTIVGAGGIALELCRLLEPFGCRITMVRRGRTSEERREAIAGALVVFLAAPLTDETRGMFGEPEFARMRTDAWLVNVSRGGLVDSAALDAALRARVIGGAALDVTDPEPLPYGHPLWTAPSCIITPHTADTAAMIAPLFAERVSTNVARFAAGEELVGRVDVTSHY